MPWRNGGGETVEIAVHPPGAGLDEFEWRVSMARVEIGGPFSVFEGVDRVLAVIEGDGLDLSIEGLGRRLLTPRSDPLRFPADAPTAARLPGGSVVDLNVMVRRGRYTATLGRLAGGMALPTSAQLSMIVALGPLLAEAGSERFSLERDDALLVQGRAVRVSGEAGFYHIAIEPAAAAA